jgi:hypothetical protein
VVQAMILMFVAAEQIIRRMYHLQGRSKRVSVVKH